MASAKTMAYVWGAGIASSLLRANAEVTHKAVEIARKHAPSWSTIPDCWAVETVIDTKWFDAISRFDPSVHGWVVATNHDKPKRMSPSEQQVWELRHLKRSEIAQRLSMKPGTVTKHMRRAKEKHRLQYGVVSDDSACANTNAENALHGKTPSATVKDQEKRNADPDDRSVASVPPPTVQLEVGLPKNSKKQKEVAVEPFVAPWDAVASRSAARRSKGERLRTLSVPIGHVVLRVPREARRDPCVAGALKGLSPARITQEGDAEYIVPKSKQKRIAADMAAAKKRI